MRKRLLCAAIAMTALLSVGCATERVVIDKPLNETRLFVTRAGGNVVLAWDSAPDMAYTIYYNYTRSAKAQWKILPGFDHIRGTGRRLEYTDTVPVDQERYYRLQAVPAVSLSH